MNIRDLEATLPNGLHDAVLRKYVVDYENAVAVLSFDVWVGDLGSDDEKERERYKSGTVTFSGLHYFVVEPPSREVALTIEPITSSAGDPEVNEIRPGVVLPEAPAGTFRAFFFSTTSMLLFMFALLKRNFSMALNKPINSDSQKQRSFVAALSAAGYGWR